MMFESNKNKKRKKKSRGKRFDNKVELKGRMGEENQQQKPNKILIVNTLISRERRPAHFLSLPLFNTGSQLSKQPNIPLIQQSVSIMQTKTC